MKQILSIKRQIRQAMLENNQLCLHSAVMLFRERAGSFAVATTALLDEIDGMLVENNISSEQQSVIIEFILSMPRIYFDAYDQQDPYYQVKNWLIDHRIYSASDEKRYYTMAAKDGRHVVNKKFELYLRAANSILRERQGAKCTRTEVRVAYGVSCQIDAGLDRVIPINTWHPVPGRDKKKTIIYVHGLQHSKEHAERLAAELCKMGFKVIAYDQVGHGLRPMHYSEINNDNLINDFKDVCAHFHKVDPEREMMVVGHSIGASVVLQSAHHMKYIQHIIAISPAMERFNSVGWFLLRAALWGRPFRQAAYTENKHFVKKKHKHHYRKHGLGFAFKNLGGILKQSYSHAFSKRSGPAHIILGSRDKVVSNHIKAMHDAQHIKVDLIQADHLSTIGVPSSIASLIYQTWREA